MLQTVAETLIRFVLTMADQKGLHTTDTADTGCNLEHMWLLISACSESERNESFLSTRLDNHYVNSYKNCLKEKE